MIILDFDGTLFNTLPVHFRIQKRKIFKPEDQKKCHLEFIQIHKTHLDLYASEWTKFFKKISLFHQIYLISESSPEILILYLEVFSLIKYFQGVYGAQFHNRGKRQQKIKDLLFLEGTGWLISDNPSDLVLRIDRLQIVSAQDFYQEGIFSFQRKLLGLEKTICKS